MAQTSGKQQPRALNNPRDACLVRISGDRDSLGSPNWENGGPHSITDTFAQSQNILGLDPEGNVVSVITVKMAQVACSN